jgi:hypothetical protein
MSTIKDAVSGFVNRPAHTDKSRHLNPMVFVAMLGFVLLAVTGYHSAHLLMNTVASDMTLIAIAGLAAFDIGFLMWPFTVKSPHSNPSQKSIGLVMTVLCGAAVALAFISDVAMTMNLGIAEAPWFRGAIVVLVATAVLSNVIAFITYHLCGSDSGDVSVYSDPQAIDYDKLARMVAGMQVAKQNGRSSEPVTFGSDSPVELETPKSKRPKG